MPPMPQSVATDGIPVSLRSSRISSAVSESTTTAADEEQRLPAAVRASAAARTAAGSARPRPYSLCSFTAVG